MVQGITRAIYGALEALNYPHPLHPQLTHITIGMVFGAFLFALLSLAFRHQAMRGAATYSAAVAFVSLFATATLGYLDWQYFFAGGRLQPVMIKLILAGILVILLAGALIVTAGRTSYATAPAVILYTLCMSSVIGLGYFGGMLVYAQRTPSGDPKFITGERLFRGNCSGCHPYGSNIVAPALPVRGSDQLDDPATFLRWIRDPRLDNGRRGIMPPFTPARIGDREAQSLFDYIRNVMPAATEEGEQPGQAAIPEIPVKTDLKSIESGRALFQANCAACHTTESTAPKVGPGLQGVLKREKLPASGRPATPENVYRQLMHPYRQMPSFSGKLSEDQMQDLIAFLATQ